MRDLKPKDGKWLLLVYRVPPEPSRARVAVWRELKRLGALAAAALVVLAGITVRRPLAMVPENTMKYAVGLLLASFGLFWAVEGMGYFAPAGESLQWPGGTWALPVILLAWGCMSRLTVVVLRGLAQPVTAPNAEIAR